MMMSVVQATETHIWNNFCCVCSVAQSCDPIDYSSPGSSVHGISQASIWEWVAISFSRPPQTHSDSCLVTVIWGEILVAAGGGEDRPWRHCCGVDG